MPGRLPGSLVRLRATWWDGPWPVEGDLLRTEAGSCYQLERMSEPGPSGARVLTCRKLEDDSVDPQQEGVFLWRFAPR